MFKSLLSPFQLSTDPKQDAFSIISRIAHALDEKGLFYIPNVVVAYQRFIHTLILYARKHLRLKHVERAALNAIEKEHVDLIESACDDLHLFRQVVSYYTLRMQKRSAWSPFKESVVFYLFYYAASGPQLGSLIEYGSKNSTLNELIKQNFKAEKKIASLERTAKHLAKQLKSIAAKQTTIHTEASSNANDHSDLVASNEARLEEKELSSSRLTK